jgi:hypothetical protein
MLQAFLRAVNTGRRHVSLDGVAPATDDDAIVVRGIARRPARRGVILRTGI